MSHSAWELLAWGVLISLVVVLLPLFLCMPLWGDCLYYDETARVLLKGEVVYREVFCIGLPGMLLLQAGLRGAFGWRSEVLRAVDILIVAAIVWLLVRRVGLRGATRATRVWTAVVLTFFYFRLTEWSHCQPDTWMLLPCLVALALRQRQMTHGMTAGAQPEWVGWRALVEGMCWGIAFVIKPYVAIPAAACFAFTLALDWRARPNNLRRLAWDAGGVLAGGLIVGAATIAWMTLTGNWSHFLEAVFSESNRDYSRYSDPLIQRTSRLLVRFWPWSLIHLAALPTALVVINRVFQNSGPGNPSPETISQAFLAVFYLGWFVEGNFLQRQFDYHLVPAVLLGLTLLAGERWFTGHRVIRCLAVPGFLLWALTFHPLSDSNRLSLWTRCWEEGSSPELRDRLALEPAWGAPRWGAPSWVDLKQVAAFLKDREVRDREVTCYDFSTLPLYAELRIKPSTRFVLLATSLAHFRSRREQILEEVMASPQKYVVTDLVAVGLDRVQAQDGDLRLPPTLSGVYPWNGPIVFRWGRYLVHRVVREESSTRQPAEPFQPPNGKLPQPP